MCAWLAESGKVSYFACGLRWRSDPGDDPGPGLCPGGEVLQRAELEFQGGVPGLDDRIVQRRARPAHRLADTQPGAGLADQARGVQAPSCGGTAA
jgi:hypothetical protein